MGGGAMNDMLSYRATKHVYIRDPVMGTLQCFLYFVILAYLIGWRLIWERGYLLTEPVTAIVQTHVTAGEVRQSSVYKYCQGSSLDFTGGRKLQCTTGPAGWVAAPSNGGNEVFVATRVIEGQADKFVINPDEFTVSITWEVQALNHYKKADDSGWSKGLPDVTTRLLGHDGQVVLDGVTRSGRYDNIPIWKLLYAAGIAGLDNQHDGSSSSEDTYRQLGVVLVITIDCLMDVLGAVKSCDYRAKKLAKTEAQARVVSDMRIASSDKGVQDRRGVKIVVHATGTMGRFDFNTLMLSICIALAVIQVFSIIIDFLMTYLLPYKGIYALHMREESVDFQDLRQKSPYAQRAVQHLQRQKSANSGRPPPKTAAHAGGAQGAHGAHSPRWPGSPQSAHSHPSSEAHSPNSQNSQHQYYTSQNQGIAPPAAISTNTHGSHLGPIGEDQYESPPQQLTPPSQLSSNQAPFQQSYSSVPPGQYGVIQQHHGATQPHGVVAGAPYQATYKQRAPAVINVDD